jgi:hypothetical protein
MQQRLDTERNLRDGSTARNGTTVSELAELREKSKALEREKSGLAAG